MNCECSELIILWFVIVLKSGGVDRTVKPVMFTSAALRLIKKGEAIVLSLFIARAVLLVSSVWKGKNRVLRPRVVMAVI